MKYNTTDACILMYYPYIVNRIKTEMISFNFIENKTL